MSLLETAGTCDRGPRISITAGRDQSLRLTASDPERRFDGDEGDTRATPAVLPDFQICIGKIVARVTSGSGEQPPLARSLLHFDLATAAKNWSCHIDSATRFKHMAGFFAF